MNGGINSMVRKLSCLLCTQHNFCGQRCKVVKCWNWEIRQFTTIQSNKYAVLILNRPISQSPEFLNKFWNNASVRMTVDGGIVQWDKFINTLAEETRKKIKLPDLITGDFDSATEEILDQYKKKGCKTIHTPDQNHTDFTKALMELNIYCNNKSIEMEHVIAIAQNSGRIDQILGNIQTLYLVRDKHLLNPNTRVYLMSDNSISWLLLPGDHVINIPEHVRKQKNSWCSLVPIGETCESVTTSGLKWNLDNQPLKFGQLVSTSNSYNGSDTVKIKCSHTVLWSMKVLGLKST